MQISSDNATQNAGGNINSYNSLSYPGTHNHTHHHHPTQSPTAKVQLRCPLPSPKFVGRTNELGRLKKFFASPEQDLKRFVLIGMGGCGKSQIASEFTHGHILKEKIYDPSRVFFVDATNLASLEQSYASIAQSNGVGSSAQDALLWLSNIEEPSFILIDNADDLDLNLTAYIPRSMNVHVLITTRLHDKGRLHASAPDALIDLEALPRKDAENLLVQTAGIRVHQLGVPKDVSVLVQELHCHALAVAQAGACIAFLHLTVGEYLEQFRRLGTSFMDGQNDRIDSSALHGYPKVARSTWELSYDQLPASSQDLFNLCAFLHHTGLTQTLFHKATEALKSYKPTVPFSPAEEAAFSALMEALGSCQGENGTFDDSAFRRCIQPILSLSLMRRDPITGVYSIHSLVLDRLQRRISDCLSTSFLLMLAITSDKKDIPFLYRLLPHVDGLMGRSTVVQGSLEPSQYHPDIAVAFSSVYTEVKRWGAAEILQRAAIAARTAELGQTHTQTLLAATSLSLILRGSCQYTAAEVLGRSLLAEYTRKCGKDDILTTNASMRLAVTLYHLKKYGEAEQLQMDVISRRRRLLGSDHPDTVSAMNNLAFTWSHLGRHQKAEKVRLEVLSKRMHLLGEDHPDTVSAMKDLANTWSNLKRYKEAEKMQLDVLSRRKRLLGDDHPHTVMAMATAADTRSYLKRYKEAEQMRLDVLARRRRLLGEDHPDTVTAMGKLASTRSQLGRYNEAEKMQLDVLSRRKHLLGEDHPDTVQAMADRAITLARLQRYREAEELCKEALQRQRHIHGKKHSATIRSEKWLAWISAQRGQARSAPRGQARSAPRGQARSAQRGQARSAQRGQARSVVGRHDRRVRRF